MKRVKVQGLCLIFLLLFNFVLGSCQFTENILQSSSEVDFTVPKNIQVDFNEKVYNITAVFNDSKLEINFIDEKDLMAGAYVCLTENSYKITYKDMAFHGERASLTDSFLPCVFYSFLKSFDAGVILDNYDKEHNCYSVKKNINGYFITFECYETDDNKFYSMEIK